MHGFFLPNPFSVIPHSSVDYRQVFRPILYFQPSPSQSDSRLYPTPYLNAQASSFLIYIHVTDLRDTMPHQRSLTHTCDLWDTMPCQRSLYTYLGKHRISLVVTIILSMCLCPHTQLDCNQFTIILGLYLYISIQ